MTEHTFFQPPAPRPVRQAIWALAMLAALLVPLTRAAASPAGGTAPAAVVRTAAHAGHGVGRVTGLKLPRFVSLKSDAARMRVGPSTDYAVRFVYMAPGLPVELLEEWGNWRQVRDQDGTTGWMHAALLSGRRTAIVAPWLTEGASLGRGPSPAAAAIALMQPGVLVKISGCDGALCQVSLERPRLSGYVAQRKLWGVYPREIIE